VIFILDVAPQECIILLKPMHIDSCRNSARFISITIFITLNFSSFLFAQQESYDSAANKGYIESHSIPETKKRPSIFRDDYSIEGLTKPQDEKNLTQFQRMARVYRSQGLELQRIGNIEGAMVLYQKAIQLDPSYPIAYNDLGIIYESKGLTDRAEENYLKAIKVDPTFLSAYTNLAIVYENKRDLEKALICWQKRAQLGLPDDPWTQKARQRLEDISMVLSSNPQDDREKEIIGLLKDVEAEKAILKKEDKALSNRYFEKAKESYAKGNYAAAIKEALDARQLDPSNKEIDKLIEKARLRALSK
jgi:tetratricopeptide (TPR) repeat protein